MITYNDTTYCVRECNNMQCKINIKHIEGQDTKGLPVSMAIFDKCKDYKGNVYEESLKALLIISSLSAPFIYLPYGIKNAVKYKKNKLYTNQNRYEPDNKF